MNVKSVNDGCYPQRSSSENSHFLADLGAVRDVLPSDEAHGENSLPKDTVRELGCDITAHQCHSSTTDSRGENLSFRSGVKQGAAEAELKPLPTKRIYFSPELIENRRSYTFADIGRRFKGMAYRTLIDWREDKEHPLPVHGRFGTRVYGEDLIRYMMDKRNNRRKPNR